MMIDGLIDLLQLPFYDGQYSKASFSVQRQLMNDFIKITLQLKLISFTEKIALEG